MEETTKPKTNIIHISGNKDITDKDFMMYYLPFLTELVKNSNTLFNISDEPGCSEYCQIFFNKILTEEDKSRVNIFGMDFTPKIYLSDQFLYIGEFKTLEERNAAMTVSSTQDLHIILEGQGRSEVEKNILRRFTPKYDYTKFIKDGNRSFWGFTLTEE